MRELRSRELFAQLEWCGILENIFVSKVIHSLIFDYALAASVICVQWKRDAYAAKSH